MSFEHEETTVAGLFDMCGVMQTFQTTDPSVVLAIGMRMNEYHFNPGTEREFITTDRYIRRIAKVTVGDKVSYHVNMFGWDHTGRNGTLNSDIEDTVVVHVKYDIDDLPEFSRHPRPYKFLVQNLNEDGELDEHGPAYAKYVDEIMRNVLQELSTQMSEQSDIENVHPNLLLHN